jgi:hypothetical protein
VLISVNLCDVVEGSAGDQHLAVDVRHTGERAAADQAADRVFGNLEHLGGLNDGVYRRLASGESVEIGPESTANGTFDGRLDERLDRRVLGPVAIVLVKAGHGFDSLAGWMRHDCWHGRSFPIVSPWRPNGDASGTPADIPTEVSDRRDPADIETSDVLEDPVTCHEFQVEYEGCRGHPTVSLVDLLADGVAGADGPAAKLGTSDHEAFLGLYDVQVAEGSQEAS